MFAKVFKKVLVGLVVFGGLVERVFAVGEDGPGDGLIVFRNPLGCDNFGCVAQAIINGLFVIAVPIVSIMVIIGGFQILTAGGDPEKFKNGKKTILYAVAGFAIIIVGLGAQFIIRSLFGP